jgi:hypothetical protein
MPTQSEVDAFIDDLNNVPERFGKIWDSEIAQAKNEGNYYYYKYLGELQKNPNFKVTAYSSSAEASNRLAGGPSADIVNLAEKAHFVRIFTSNIVVENKTAVVELDPVFNTLYKDINSIENDRECPRPDSNWHALASNGF